jgi:hypothetical protein
MGARVGRSQQDGDKHQQDIGSLFIPQFNRLHDSYITWGEDTSNVVTLVQVDELVGANQVSSQR